MTEMTQRKKDGWEPVMLGGGSFKQALVRIKSLEASNFSVVPLYASYKDENSLDLT